MLKKSDFKTMQFFLILSFLSTLSFADVLTDSRDGNKYKTHRFCSNNWMIQELRYVPQKPGCKSYPYRDYEANKNGGLKYDNFSAKNCSICPEGWHIPTDLDVERLFKCEKDRLIWDNADLKIFYLDYNEEHWFGYFYLDRNAYGVDRSPGAGSNPRDVRCVQDDKRKIPYTEGSFTDKRDGKKYKTITVGGKTWFAQNLDYWTDSSFCAVANKMYDEVTVTPEYPTFSHELWGSHNCRKSFTKEYYDEEMVGEKKVKKKLGNITIEIEEPVYQKVKKKYQYNPDPNDQVYGRYYNREEALKSCPVGWHLSTRKDWLDLRASTGDVDLEDSKYRYGSKNHINFSALPLGYIGEREVGERSGIVDQRLNTDEHEYVIIKDYYVVYWRMDDEVGPFVINNLFKKGDEQRLFAHIYENKKIFAPVRCVKDD